ncbi:hypothetical protein E2C01_071831 [Portunus trituberculatus]|uniref:Uncharacterized protein n=1 Tax=Portunus trituberculatus TaxID=210409 RepID=A0A5B7I663_PORTR|nr:hypothetical protein [Portunus trituberculatus]
MESATFTIATSTSHCTDWQLDSSLLGVTRICLWKIKAKSVKEGRSCDPAFLDTLTLSQRPGFQDPALVGLLQAHPAIMLVKIKQQQQPLEKS